MKAPVRCGAMVAMAALVQAVAACGSATDPTGLDPGMVAAGRATYLGNGCANCHGEDGSGRGGLAAGLDPPPRDYRDPAAYRGGTDVASIARTIAEGMPAPGGGMPSFRHLSEERRTELATFIASLQHPDSAEVSVRDAWVAAPVPGSDATAAWLRIVNRGGANAVVGVEASGARRAGLHGSPGADMASMKSLSRLELPAGGEVVLAPGRQHIMLERLRAPLAAGDTVAITLFLASRTAVRFEAPVRPYGDAPVATAAPAAPMAPPAPQLGTFDIGGDFELETADGGRFALAGHRGQPFLLFFGYTHCPDFCPATLSLLGQVDETLGDAGQSVTTLFVTIDPERDTAAALTEYLRHFSVPTVGLRGSVDEVQSVLQRYAGLSEREEREGGETVFGHTTYVYLIDADGRVRYMFRPDDAVDFIAAGVRQVLEGAGPPH